MSYIRMFKFGVLNFLGESLLVDRCVTVVPHRKCRTVHGTPIQYRSCNQYRYRYGNIVTILKLNPPPTHFSDVTAKMIFGKFNL
jgi:hypothetical protein